MQIHNCLLSTMVEIVLFGKNNSINNKDKVPDDDCSICLEKLTKPSSSGCCGTYSRQLLCGHWVHVSCMIDRNPDRHRCPLCRKELVDKKWLDSKIEGCQSYDQFLKQLYQKEVEKLCDTILASESYKRCRIMENEKEMLVGVRNKLKNYADISVIVELFLNLKNPDDYKDGDYFEDNRIYSDGLGSIENGQYFIDQYKGLDKDDHEMAQSYLFTIFSGCYGNGSVVFCDFVLDLLHQNKIGFEDETPTEFLLCGRNFIYNQTSYKKFVQYLIEQKIQFDGSDLNAVISCNDPENYLPVLKLLVNEKLVTVEKLKELLLSIEKDSRYEKILKQL